MYYRSRRLFRMAIISQFSHFNVLYKYFTVKIFTGICYRMQQEYQCAVVYCYCIFMYGTLIHFSNGSVLRMMFISSFIVLYEYFAVKIFTGIRYHMQQEQKCAVVYSYCCICIVHWYTSAMGLYWEWSYPFIQPQLQSYLWRHHSQVKGADQENKISQGTIVSHVLTVISS